MSEFIDPIKKVKKKVKLLEEASQVIKSSLRQQLEHQREIKGLEVAKTEEYAKQAKPIVEAVGTQPSEEEKKLAKQNDRNIVISNLNSSGIPTYDPSYNIILKYFDDSYDTIKQRKTDALKQRDIDMMVSSIDSLLTDNDAFKIPTPIGKLSKNIFEKIFFSRDFALTGEEQKDIEAHEQLIQDREQTEAERTQVEAERKIEEQKKEIEAQAEKRRAEKTEEELKRIENSNQANEGLKNIMYTIYMDRVNEQGLKYESYKKSLDIAFKFIHPQVILEQDDNIRQLKIQGLVDSDNLKKKIPNTVIRNRIKNALLRTYTSAVVGYASTKLATDPTFEKELGILIGKKRTPPPEEKAPEAPPVPRSAPPDPPKLSPIAPAPPVRAVSDEGFEDAKAEPEPLPPTKPPITTKSGIPFFSPIKEGKTSLSDEIAGIAGPEEEKATTDDIEAVNRFVETPDADKLLRTKEGNLYSSFGYVKKNLESVKPEFSKNDRIYLQIKLAQKYKESIGTTGGDDPSGSMPPKTMEKIKEAQDRAQAYIASKQTQLDKKYMERLMSGRGLKGKNQKGGFNFLNMLAPIPLVGDGISMEDLRTKTSSGIKKKLGLGMVNLNQKNFEKKIKKQSNEDLLHNLKVHMSEVQAGNTGLKAPIQMLLNEALGRGIMKKQMATKIGKNFL